MELDPDRSDDAFYHGRFHLIQPRKGGHRAGMDALVLAAAVPTAFAGTLVDFGAGTGAIGLAVASRCPEARIVLVEKSTEMADYARQTLAHPANAPLAGRVSLVVADVTASAPEREGLGLAARSADFIVMNPPFNDAADRATPDPLKRAAHVMEADLFETWIRAAAALARPRAQIAVIARPASLQPILAALSRRFGSADLVAVHARATLGAIRIVVRARQGSRGGLSILPPLVLHEGEAQAFTTRAEAIHAGEAALFGD